MRQILNRNVVLFIRLPDMKEGIEKMGIFSSLYFSIDRKFKPDTYVRLSLDKEDYYRIMDAEGGAKIE